MTDTKRILVAQSEPGEPPKKYLCIEWERESSKLNFVWRRYANEELLLESPPATFSVSMVIGLLERAVDSPFLESDVDRKIVNSLLARKLIKLR